MVNSPVREIPASQVQSNTVLSNVSWSVLEALDDNLAETGARLVYLDGCLEIMVPLSEEHEEPKKLLAQLLEAYMRLKGIRFYAKGSATIGLKQLGARKEPDESYCVGERSKLPNLAIEITVTSGGLDVLEIYRRIGVREVWFWEDGVIAAYALGEQGYEQVYKSQLLPELDIRSLEFHSRMADQFDAVNSFIETL